MNIYVVGSGKLSTAILTSGLSLAGHQVLGWASSRNIYYPAIIVRCVQTRTEAEDIQRASVSLVLLVRTPTKGKGETSYIAPLSKFPTFK